MTTSPLFRLPSFPAAGRALLAVAGLWALGPALHATPHPEKVVGPASCAECHPQEIDIWKASTHFKSFNQIQRRPEAADILAKMGVANMKAADAQCMECHFLTKQTESMPAPNAVAGISCESCHGPAREWILGHGDYGRGVKKAAESAEHRTARRADAVAHGMIGPDDLYGLGSNCYRCHVLQDEKLANVGGHTAGSKGFDFLAWSQGEVRHNVLNTEGKSNPEATPENKRRMLAIGWILETEFCFRATAKATEKAVFGVTYARRADAARKMLEKIQGLAPTPEMAAILDVARPVGLRLNNAAELTAAADKISALGRTFSDKVTGAQLAGLDALLPGPDAYKGTPFAIASAP